MGHNHVDQQSHSGSPRREVREKGTEWIFEEIMAEKFLTVVNIIQALLWGKTE